MGDPKQLARNLELRRKIDAVGMLIAGGLVDVRDLAKVDQVAGAVRRLLDDPARAALAKRRGFDIIEARRRHAGGDRHFGETRHLAAAGYHVLQAGLDPREVDVATVVGATATVLQANGEGA
ncbi:hypothetical protein [Microvirga pudoricolor]|uniref:hypothetical protein n=1 Tax=Microvirga pudoricolor TaxID=2778729 RepID=UPI00194ECB40|nr:hypothetical protein [Microvirga pudoricolor]MBM6595350.1 hypothetical protein [Microvirga pudoricolor]